MDTNAVLQAVRMRLIKWPDQRVSCKCALVPLSLVAIDKYEQRDLQELIADMFKAMYTMNGVGLAAPQLGYLIRLAVIDIGRGKTSHPITLINPSITAQSGKASMQEGCLSFPGLQAPLVRPQKVTVRSQTVTGEWFEFEAEGLLARACCHEIDHLDGRLFITRLTALKRDRLKKKAKQLIKDGVW